MISKRVKFVVAALNSTRSVGSSALLLRTVSLCLWLCFLMPIASVSNFARAAPGDITTIAGGDNIGDGGSALMARLSGPSGIALDRAGNVYFADSSFHRIRKITTSTGVITTIAGTGKWGFSGDGGIATNAEISDPIGIALDSSGNVFISDQSNSRIRKVNVTTGIITTVAGIGGYTFSGDGGPATSAGLANPGGIAIDGADNIYIADTLSSRIRKITASTGTISTVAGNGGTGFAGDHGLAIAASLGYPSAVAVDSEGTLYIADRQNNRVRVVAVSTGIISTLAGTGETNGAVGDGGAAIAAVVSNPIGVIVDSAKNVYIAAGNRVRKVAAASGIITTFAGGGPNGYFLDNGDNGPATSAQLAPFGIVFDSAGNLYISESGAFRIRKVTSVTGVITTIAGTGSPNFSGDTGDAKLATLNGPSGLTRDNLGNIYFIDGRNYRVRKVAADTGQITSVAGNSIRGFAGDGGPATRAALDSASGIAVDTAGNIYIADSLNHRIRKVTTSNGIITTIVGTGAAGFTGDGGLAINATLGYPSGIAIDTNGNLFISEFSNASIRKVNVATGIISTVAGTGVLGFSGDNGPAVNATLGNVYGLALDRSDNIYIVDPSNSRIRKVVAATGIITTIAGTGAYGFSGDFGPATSASLFGPAGIVIDGMNNIYISDSNSSRVRKITANNGIITTIAGTSFFGFSGDNGPATVAQLYSPKGVTVDGRGNVYVADEGNNRIRKIASPVVDAKDLNGDGNSDLIFRNAATGQISAWLMNGIASTSTAGLVPAGNWTVTHTADFNGDGKADILYRNDDGSTTLWLMNGLTVAGSVGLLGPNPDWRVSHVADFNGDGRADILWRNTNGAVTLWLMDGTTVTSSIGLLGADPGWSVSHVADFNGDGKADLLWRNTNGAVTLWLMNGTAIASTAGLLGADRNWRVSHVADFDGDGKADLLWRNTNGAVTAWLMNGSAIASTAGLLGPDANWSVSHTGDFNGDGKADLLWRNNNGAVTQWLMNGTSILSTAGLLGADPNWRVTHIGDYNGDGKADLVWRNASDGAITMWLMNGAATLSAAGILGATAWGVVPPLP